MDSIRKLIRQAKSIAVKGLIIVEEVDEETANWRFNICLTSENGKPCRNFDPDPSNAEIGKCLGCGCLLPEKTYSKTNRTLEHPNGEVTHCPLGRWDDLILTNYYRVQDGLAPIVQ